ncbi:Hypothetical protein PHPALM_3552, partial [Phytophthora palmivora]
MRMLWTLVLVGLASWAPPTAAEVGGTLAGLPPRTGPETTGSQPQETVKTRAQVQMKRRLLDSTDKMPSPRDPFMFGDVSIKSHPTKGTASLSVRSGKVYRFIDSVKSPGAVVGATSVPTSQDIRTYVNVGDIVFLGQLDARTVLGVNSTSIIIDVGLQHQLTGGESIEVRKRVFSTIEETTVQSMMNSRGMQLYSRDDTVNASAPHKVMQIRHFTDASSTRARLLPGNVSVVHGSDTVTTLVDLSNELSESVFVRLAGGSYLVDPTRPVTSTKFFLDRPFAGSSYDDLPIYVDGIGAGILLEVRAGTDVRAGASIDVTATTIGQVNATDVIISTMVDGLSAGRVKFNHTGIDFLGDCGTISSEVGIISLQPAKDLSLIAGSLDNKPGSEVTVRSGTSNWQIGGNIDMETGQSNYGTKSGNLLLHTSDGVPAHASSGSVDISSGKGNAGHSGTITLSSGNAKTGESGSIHLATGSTESTTGIITIRSGLSLGGDSGSVSVATSKASG